MPSRRSTRKSSTDWWIWTHFLCIPIRFVVSPLELLMHWFLYNHSIWLPIHLTVTVIWLGLQVGFNVYIYSFIHYFEWKWDSCLLSDKGRSKMVYFLLQIGWELKDLPLVDQDVLILAIYKIVPFMLCLPMNLDVQV